MRCAANVVFIIGMYWCARSPDTDRTRIRDCNPVVESEGVISEGVGLESAAETSL